MRVLIENRITPKRYEVVKSIMGEIGAPIIKCFKLSSNTYYALEGSHRVTAAKELGLEPILDVISEVAESDHEDCDEIYRVRLDSKSRIAKGLLVDF